MPEPKYVETLSEGIEARLNQWSPLGLALHSFIRRGMKLGDTRKSMDPRGETDKKEVWKDGGQPKHLEIDSFVRRRAKEVWKDGCLEVQRQPTGVDDELRNPLLLDDDHEIAARLGFFGCALTHEGISKGVL
eukprot:8474750-Pyramimonas_sp.AAC.1